MPEEIEDEEITGKSKDDWFDQDDSHLVDENIPLSKPLQTFEEFLEEVHSSMYHGTKDDMEDDCNDWMADLDVQELIDYAQEWGNSLTK